MINLTKIVKEYKGLWVALTEDWKLISYNKDIKKAHGDAVKKGYNTPIMYKVPKKNIAYFGSSMNG